MMPNQFSIWFNQDDRTGVKWRCTVGFSSNQAWTSAVLWVDRLSRTTCTSRPACGLTAALNE